MRALYSRAPALLSAAALLAGLAGLAVAAEVRAAPAPAEAAPAAPAAGRAERDQDVGASCRTVVEGSSVTAHCQNPYPRTDRVRLHIECERWWDVDSDSAAVAVGPADYAQVTGHCWKEVRSAWITHEPAAPGS
ncbi:hypothetical protein [Streptomyces showdoensis]|uniref:Secreted protein n=1 Tax=Streptomyces showdoensis TaxID=68268 RepID=A0A2P2GPL5_STREW|nr:hypothetical protein [Streptomyces showdoensis]KKZ73434.1 hypothetical protein VO63_13430 [Streptomyces showdoensis]